MPQTALIWLKRDLRLDDHAPLAAAAAFDAAAAVYVIEPAWLASAECDSQHVAFALEGLAELRRTLAARGLPLLVRVGEVRAVFDALRESFPFTDLLSHEETGPGWSFERDRAVAAWCRERGVQWQEWAQTGVVRRLRTRDGWARRWQARMGAAPVDMPARWRGATTLAIDDELPDLRALGLPAHGKTLQPSGETAAQATLASFLNHRGHRYLKSISSPLTAASGGSRLSPYLAFGMLSMRRVHHATEAAIARSDDAFVRRPLRGFAGRLRWHCHFVQKLETQPSMEFRNLARSADGLRESEFDRTRFDAWCAGQTGYPMVDACMRSLRATGWLNFRMRAMLVSFAAYHLWLHWREPGLFLARQFLDFEAGIHWSQMQMQSGTTGINTTRVYNPIKQARDQDPSGVFVRRWLPAMRQVPDAWLFEPWRMPEDIQARAGLRVGTEPQADIPLPLVDLDEALRTAKARLHARRAEPAVRAAKQAVVERHGSRAHRPGRKRARRAERSEAGPSEPPSSSDEQLTLGF